MRGPLMAVMVVVLSQLTPATAQTNSWTNSVSGLWHEDYWADGLLPGAGQTIFITNSGAKTVTLTADTAEIYPQSLTNKSVLIFAPEGSTNTLFLNTGTTNIGLAVSDSLVFSNRSELVVLGSWLQANRLRANSVIKHGEFSRVEVRDRLQQDGNGIYYLTNGTLWTLFHDVGSIFTPAVFNQYGGTNSCVGSCSIRGTYNLLEGRFEMLAYSRTFLVGAGSGSGNLSQGQGVFNQSGGVVDGGIILGWQTQGTYNLSGGLRTGGPVRIIDGGSPGIGHFLQTGGTNVGSVEIAPHISESGDGWESSYILSGGELWSTTVEVGNFGSFVQTGGVHVNQHISLFGGPVCRRHQPGYPNYPDCPDRRGTYRLQSGILITSDAYSGVSQTGGQWIIQPVQTNPPPYSATGRWIALTNALWIAGAGDENLARLWLKGDSHLSFPTNECVLRFEDSSDLEWSGLLVVSNWQGSFSGSGIHQLKFGADASNLTPGQLGKIYFLNPRGRTGLHPARILPDGEVVPLPVLLAQSHGSGLQIQWEGSFALQTATNVHGPYEDVLEATNPYTVPFEGAQRFFRLRE